MANKPPAAETPRSDPFSLLTQEEFVSGFHTILCEKLSSGDVPFTDCHQLDLRIGEGQFICRASTYFNLLRTDCPLITPRRYEETRASQVAFDKKCLVGRTALLSADFLNPGSTIPFASLHMGVADSRELLSGIGSRYNEAFAAIDNQTPQDGTVQALVEIDGQLSHGLDLLVAQSPDLVSLLVEIVRNRVST